MDKKCLHILPMNKLSGAEKLALILCENLKEICYDVYRVEVVI